MENLSPELYNLDEDEEIRVELAKESDIEGEEENFNRLDNFRHVHQKVTYFQQH